MDLSILANPKFGWIFIWSQIILLYLGFLYFHRVVERKRKAK
jgi:hypothetical protein